jgi:hypothetical protein
MLCSSLDAEAEVPLRFLKIKYTVKMAALYGTERWLSGRGAVSDSGQRGFDPLGIEYQTGFPAFFYDKC